MATDARQRTKVYLDTYWTFSNATDDDGNPLGVKVLFAYPEYPLELELQPPSCVDVLVLVDQPNSTPMIDAVTQAPYGYEEHVPIELVTLDKSDMNVTGIKAIWQAEAEMRRVLENNPTGSLRSVERTENVTKRLGSTVLWSAKYTFNYRRDTST